MVRIVIITGLSGSGKSTAIKALEDLGFYCVDNLPVTLLPKFVELCEDAGEITRVGLGVDVRGGEFLKSFSQVLRQISGSGHDVEILFLESDDEVLVRRFSETRRFHPLAASGTVLDGIGRERGLLAGLRNEATKVIDTSACNVHQLKRLISDYVSDQAFSRKMTLNLVSFGFKYAILYEADIIMDVRFLPNPNFVDDLKGLTGEDKGVADFVFGGGEGEPFMERFSSLLNYLIPHYVSEGKSYLTIGIGCTGGRHRSVAVVERLARELLPGDYSVKVLHRDKNRV